MSRWERAAGALIAGALFGFRVAQQYGYVKGYEAGSAGMRKAMDAQLRVAKRRTDLSRIA